MDTSTASLITDVAVRAAAQMRVSPSRREDLRQEAALAAVEALPRFDAGRGDLAGFLYCAALNRIRNVLARDNREHMHRVDGRMETDVPDAADLDYEPLTHILSLDEARDRTERLRALRAALNTLPSDDVQLLRRIYVDCARHHEIANEAACSRQAITKRHNRALERARAAIRVPLGVSE